MKTARSLSLKIIALAAGLLAAPSLAHAVPFTYNYTGNAYTFASPPYTTADSISGSFTVDLPSNLSFGVADVTAFLVTFSFFDGENEIDDINIQTIDGFDIGTDAAGNITQWFISLTSDMGDTIITSNLNFNIGDFGISDTGTGFNVFAPGTWAQAPEPSSLALFALALGGLGFAARRRAS